MMIREAASCGYGYVVRVAGECIILCAYRIAPSLRRMSPRVVAAGLSEES